jgi:hypothetical protein
MTDEREAALETLEYKLFKQYSKRIVQTLFKSDSNNRLPEGLLHIRVEAKNGTIDG